MQTNKHTKLPTMRLQPKQTAWERGQFWPKRHLRKLLFKYKTFYFEVILDSQEVGKLTQRNSACPSSGLLAHILSTVQWKTGKLRWGQGVPLTPLRAGCRPTPSPQTPPSEDPFTVSPHLTSTNWFFKYIILAFQERSINPAVCDLLRPASFGSG